MNANDYILSFIDEINKYEKLNLSAVVKERLNDHLNSYLHDLNISYMQLVVIPGKRKTARELFSNGNKHKKRSVTFD